MHTSVESQAEARPRFLRSKPTTTSEGFDAWLEGALSRGASIVLQLDGCRAEYVGASAPASKVCAAKGIG
jgi:hypothetical protein